MRLIGLNGFKTSGKDTTCAMLQDLAIGKTVHRAAFADKLKHMAAAALGYEGGAKSAVDLMDECKESWLFSVADTKHRPPDETFQRFTGREYLQWFGGNARKVFNDTFWIDQALPRPEDGANALHDRFPGADIVVVTDVRYENEAARIHALGGEVWEILRPGTESDGHASEIQLPSSAINLILHNSGDLHGLKSAVQKAMALVNL